MKQGRNYFADKRRELMISVDQRLQKEPLHCHLFYKGEKVGCILLEAEDKGKTFKSGVSEGSILKIFKKNALRLKFEFIPEINQQKLNGFIERYRDDCWRSMPLGGKEELNDKDLDMIEIASKFARMNAEALINEQINL